MSSSKIPYNIGRASIIQTGTARYNSHTNGLFIDNEIIKLGDIINNIEFSELLVN